MAKALIFIFYLTTTAALCQSAREQLQIANSAKLISSGFYEEIPFQDKNGYLIIPVQIGTETYQYIFDTGGYNTVTTEIMEKNNLPTLLEVEVGSANKIKTITHLSKVPSVKIGSVAFENVGVFKLDFAESPLIQCLTNGGLIGKGMIKECIWQVDYQRKLIRISDQLNKMPNLENSIKLKVRLDKVFNPFIKVEINGQSEEFLLDLGFGGFISLTEKTAQKHVSARIVEINGEGTMGANGISQEKLFVTQLKSLRMANKDWVNPTAFYSKPNNYNLIGSSLAKHFIITLNFKDKELILTPFKIELDESNESFGFDINSKDGKSYVSRLYQGQSADQAGLRLNEEVLKVNGSRLSEMAYCDFYFFIRKVLQSTQPIALEIMRDGKNTELQIRKQRIFN
jgi:predicted aspartyl protease